MLDALDPLQEDGAVARFLRSLRDELKGADEDRAKQLATALAALNANDENSLINRLVRETHVARQEVLNAVNPDAVNSPIAILKASLTTLLKEHAVSQTEIFRARTSPITLPNASLDEPVAVLDGGEAAKSLKPQLIAFR